MRLVRSEMLEVLRTDYIKFARARGIADRSIYFRHALKNTLIPVITVAGCNWRADRLFHHHRDGVSVARPRPPDHPGDHVRRHPGDRRLPDADRALVRDHQRAWWTCSLLGRRARRMKRSIPPPTTSSHRRAVGVAPVRDSDVVYSFRRIDRGSGVGARARVVRADRAARAVARAAEPVRSGRARSCRRAHSTGVALDGGVRFRSAPTARAATSCPC